MATKSLRPEFPSQLLRFQGTDERAGKKLVRDINFLLGAVYRNIRDIVNNNVDLQVNKDGDVAMTQPLVLASFTVAGLPTASDWTRGLIYVSDEIGGATLAFSDGTNWRRVQDRAVVS